MDCAHTVVVNRWALFCKILARGKTYFCISPISGNQNQMSPSRTSSQIPPSCCWQLHPCARGRDEATANIRWPERKVFAKGPLITGRSANIAPAKVGDGRSPDQADGRQIDIFFLFSRTARARDAGHGGSPILFLSREATGPADAKKSKAKT